MCGADARQDDLVTAQLPLTAPPVAALRVSHHVSLIVDARGCVAAMRLTWSGGTPVCCARACGVEPAGTAAPSTHAAAEAADSSAWPLAHVASAALIRCAAEASDTDQYACILLLGALAGATHALGVPARLLTRWTSATESPQAPMCVHPSSALTTLCGVRALCCRALVRLCRRCLHTHGEARHNLLHASPCHNRWHVVSTAYAHHLAVRFAATA